MSSYKGSYVSDSLVLNDYVITPLIEVQSFVQFAIVRAMARNCIIQLEVGREKMTKIFGTL